MDAADKLKLAALRRGIDETAPAYLDAARLIAHCALADRDDPIRADFVGEVLCAGSVERINAAHDAMLDCIALCEPRAGMTSEDRLSRIQWVIYRALRDRAADWCHDLKGDRDPACAALGIELPEDDDRDAQTYDDRGEPVSIGGAP